MGEKSKPFSFKLEPSFYSELRRECFKKGYTKMSHFVRVILKTFYKKAPKNID